MATLNNITNNIANSTITRNEAGQSLSSGRYYAYVGITANDGYIFSDSGNYTVNGGDYSVTYNNTRTVATFYVYGYNGYNAAISFNGVLEQLAPTPQITNNISDTAETHTYQNNVLTVTVTGSNTNYRFTTAPTFTYTDTNGNEKTVNLSVSVSSGISTATATINDFDVTKTAQINGVYERVILISTNLQNCEISPNFEYYTASGTQSFTITAANGYEFDTAPTATFTINGTYSQSSLGVAQNKLTAAITINLAQSGLTSIEFYARPTIAYGVTIQNNISDTAETHTYQNNVLTVTVTGSNTNYRFTTAPTFTYTDTNGNEKTVNLSVSVSSGISTATATINDFDVNFDGNIYGVYERALTPILYATNCAVSGLPPYLTSSTVLQLTATANTNCIFETTPNLTFTLSNGLYLPYNFVVSANQKTATLSLNMQTDLNGWTFADLTKCEIGAEAVADTTFLDRYGTINLYAVTPQNLKSFAEKRFFEGNDTNHTLIDLGNYVTSIRRIYCTVGDTAPTVLWCGNYNTQINVNAPLQDNIILNCGTIEIPRPNNTIVDFDSEINVFLPFIGMRSIPTDYIGKTINLQYVVNLVTTNAVAMLQCNGISFDIIECNISNDVIYKTSNVQIVNTVGNLDFNMNVLKGLQPYAVIKYYTDKNAQIFNADCLRVPLSEISGYFAAKEIENFVSDTITETEKEILLNEIANGVFILAV